MGKSKHKISNWKQYNQALVQRGSLTVGVVAQIRELSRSLVI